MSNTCTKLSSRAFKPACLSCHSILTDSNLSDDPLYADPFFLFTSQFQTLQLFSLLLSLPHLIFHDSSHHLCSFCLFCLHHPSIVVLQSLALPFLLVISVKSFPFNCHFWNSPPPGDSFFSLQCLFCSQGRQFFHLCYPVSSPLERAVSVLTPTKSFEGTSSNNDLPCPAVGPISFPKTWMLFFSLYIDLIQTIFLSSSNDWFYWCPPPTTLTVQPAGFKGTGSLT